jgi:hypothetical protein
MSKNWEMRSGAISSLLTVWIVRLLWPQFSAAVWDHGVERIGDRDVDHASARFYLTVSTVDEFGG